MSITYDPFTTLPVPIPKLKKVDVYFVPQFNIKKTVKLSIFISEDALFFDIAHYINSNLEEKIGRFRCMIVSNNECVSMVKASNNIIASTSKGYIFCCEVDPKLVNCEYHNLVVHIKQADKEEFKSYPRIITVTPTMTLKDFRLIIYGFMRRFIDLPAKVNSLLEGKYEDLLTKDSVSYDEYSEIIKEEYDLIFNNTHKSGELSEDVINEIKNFVDNLPFELYLYNPKDGSYNVIFDVNINKILEDLNFNEKGKKRNYQLLNDSESLKSVIDMAKLGYKIILEMKDQNNFINPDKLRSLQTCVSIASKEKVKPLNIFDCLEHFRLTEKLGKNNEWYCKDCKKHQQAFKKLELFYTPKLLVLQLKRFEYSSMGKYRTYAEKIGGTIDSPIDNLDMSPYIIGPDSNNAIYELYAVSQHYGSCGGGHYTAICKNGVKWYDFNDSSVSSSSEHSVVNSAAYLLFYRRKDI